MNDKNMSAGGGSAFGGKKILLIVAILAIVGFLFYEWKNSGESPVVSANADIIYFHGKGCPHCAIVEEFMKKNGVEEKIKMENGEIYFNKENAAIFKEKASTCGIPEDQMGVPLLWVKGKCYTGDKDIISYFEEQLNAKK
jgi:glutaredoxin